MLAKLASEIAPKGSVLQITPDNLFYYLAAAPLRDVCGIGHRLQKHLRRLNVQSPLALNFVSDADLALWCGPHWAQELRSIGRGEETHFLAQSDHSEQAMKSVSRSITGWQLCRHEAAMRRILRNLVDEVVSKSRQMKLAGHHVSVSLEGSKRGQWWFRHQAVPTPVRHSQVMFGIITKLLNDSWHSDWPVIRWRVALSDLDDWNHAPAAWLPEWQRQEKLETARAAINERFGNFTVFPASLLGGTIIKPEVTGFWGDKNFYRLKGRDEHQDR
jgi:DNA polymerase-4